MPQSNKLLSQQPTVSLSLLEIAELLVKHKDFHEGLYNLAFEFQIGVGSFGPDPDSAMPGAMFGIKSIGITKTEIAGPGTVDAAKINPVKTPNKRRATSSK